MKIKLNNNRDFIKHLNLNCVGIFEKPHRYLWYNLKITTGISSYPHDDILCFKRYLL